MAKYYGKIGYADTIEKRPGVWVDEIVEREYFGDMIRNKRRLTSTANLNDNINITNELSIVADPYALQNFHNIKYVEYMGTRWKITDAEVQYPRLILGIGGIYNGGEEN